MPRYDFSKCNPYTLNEFFQKYAAIREGDWKPAAWPQFMVLREQALVKTRADYDREIAAIVRGESEEEMPFGVNYWEWGYFIDLVKKSKGAPEK